MGLAQYQILPQGDEWGILHDGDVKNTYATKEAAFEAAVAAASLAIREGHEVHTACPIAPAEIKRLLGRKISVQCCIGSGRTILREQVRTGLRELHEGQLRFITQNSARSLLGWSLWNRDCTIRILQ